MPKKRSLWPFAKTVQWTCADGSEPSVFKNPSIAFPLHFSDWVSKQKAAVDVVGAANAKVESDVRLSVNTVLVGLDEANRSMQAHFAAIYLTYASDPCSNADYLRVEVKRIIDRETDLRHLSFACELLRSSMNEGTSEQIQDALASLIAAVTNSLDKDRAEKLHSAHDLVARWGSR